MSSNFFYNNNNKKILAFETLRPNCKEGSSFLNDLGHRLATVTSAPSRTVIPQISDCPSLFNDATQFVFLDLFAISSNNFSN